MKGPKRSSGERSNAWSESKYTNLTRFDPFDSEIPWWRFRGTPEVVVPVKGSSGVSIYVRRLHPAFLRPCSPSEVAEVLASIPPAFLAGVESVHLLGGSLKQVRAASSKLFHYGCYSAGRICLHAFPRVLLNQRFRSLPKPHVMHEHLRAGAVYAKEGARYMLRFSELSLNRFYLYDVLLHEVGHHVERGLQRRGRRGAEGYARWFAVERAKHLLAGSSAVGCITTG